MAGTDIRYAAMQWPVLTCAMLLPAIELRRLNQTTHGSTPPYAVAPYPMPTDNDIRYDATRSPGRPGYAMLLRVCYAMSGTELP
eukprot:3935730-Rhodomonas_salina.2